MSFEEDVRKQIAKKRDEEAARKAQKEQLEAEKIGRRLNKQTPVLSHFTTSASKQPLEECAV